MMRRIAAGRNISQPNELSERIVVKTVGCEEVYTKDQYCATTTKWDSLPAWMLSPAPVQKYPIFLGLMLLPTKGGDGNGGVGS